LRIRSATSADMHRLADFEVDDPVGVVDAALFWRLTSAGHLRPEWSWFAENDSTIVARGLWWGREDSKCPTTLDCLHVIREVSDRSALAAELLVRAHDEFDGKPDYELRVPAGSSDHGSAVEWRSDAARAAGLTRMVERLQFEWNPRIGVAADSGRLIFRTGTDNEFLDALQRVAVDSLDAETHEQLARMDPEDQARGELEFYRSCPGERSWWRLAERPDGELVGFAIPSATPYNRNVGYLGVLPEHRGHGYVDELLAEITRFHASHDADRITSTTDAANTPMVAAFKRAKYELKETRLVFSVPVT
jgi:RimJ/RimL family protein N-acetyltransferase